MTQMPPDASVDLRVYVRDIVTSQWQQFPAAKWVDEFSERFDMATDLFLDSFGGTLTVSGTAEMGRITVTAADNRTPLMDIDWYTRSAAEPPPRSLQPPG